MEMQIDSVHVGKFFADNFSAPQFAQRIFASRLHADCCIPRQYCDRSIEIKRHKRNISDIDCLSEKLASLLIVRQAQSSCCDH